MYRNVIEIKKTVPESRLKELAAIAENAFNNRAGKVQNTSRLSHTLIFEGGAGEYACLEIGMLNLKREAGFLECVSAWEWVDDDPDECCDLLGLFIGAQGSGNGVKGTVEYRRP